MSKTLIFGNWKMAQSFDRAMSFLDDWSLEAESVEVGLFPSYPHLLPVIERAPKSVSVGAQDFSDEASGAFTSEVSGQMLVELGCRLSLLGHSEVRQRHSESNESLSKKLRIAQDLGVRIVFCVGEDLAAREDGRLQAVLEEQLSVLESFSGKLVIAYEPVWAIGTGRTAENSEIEEAHNWISNRLPGKPVIYGGSVKPENSKEILSLDAVDGLLVGGASLSAKDFRRICESGLESS